LHGEHYRITPVTQRVVRLEWSPSGRFEDRPSTFAIHRDLPVPEYRLTGTDTGLRLVTNSFTLDYDLGPFSTNGLSLAVGGGVSNYHSVWRYEQDLSLPGDRRRAREGKPTRPLDGNLGGALRTLDNADGEVDLEPGVNSTNGFAVIDDSTSMVFAADGRLVPRDAEPGSKDLYVFSAGRDHVGAVRDYFAISGEQPILPRWALGNWWSRYHRYTEDSYLQLLDRFESEDIPLSVAVIDMDWHLTDVDPKYGSGWTGYTWDKALFPDPARFQQALHDRGLTVTLNVHPADGVRAFEDPYAAMCEALGRPADGTPVDFDVTDPAFMDAYFSVLHRSLEELGTDFWWIDWQSGPYSKRAGMDPLWILNHGHFEDTAKQAGRGITFSRFAGPGSHRYPVGFSGDAIITWESLAFQPRLTAAGANIGYGWWSHDIGGHMDGVKDDELTTRWVQFGVFSPIMRLHSSNSRFSGKEPWKVAEPGQAVIGEHMRLRHRMVPYLHAMNLRAHRDGRSLIEPVYFEDHAREAYQYQDEYLFGSQLLVAPVVRPADPVVRRAAADVYVPGGRWVDVFTGHAYEGAGAVRRLYRGIETIPVLLRAGGFLPLVAEGASLDLDEVLPELEVLVAGGADGEFVLEEEVADGEWAGTRFALDVAAGELRIEQPAEVGAADAARREDWIVTLLGFDRHAVRGSESGTGVGADAEAPALDVAGGEVLAIEDRGDRLRVHVRADAPESDGGAPVLVLRGAVFSTTGAPAVLDEVESLLAGAHVGYRLKDQVFDLVEQRGTEALRSVQALGRMPHERSAEAHDYDVATPELVEALVELLE
jgi:alpha-glucosidase (family GH31 glycosyl hydrolase)